MCDDVKSINYKSKQPLATCAQYMMRLMRYAHLNCEQPRHRQITTAAQKIVHQAAAVRIHESIATLIHKRFLAREFYSTAVSHLSKTHLP
jgi:hypothetical protein